MIKLNKITSLILSLLAGAGVGISFMNIDFNNLEGVKNIVSELSLPIVFLIAGINFMYIYITHLKNDGSIK